MAQTFDFDIFTSIGKENLLRLFIKKEIDSLLTLLVLEPNNEMLQHMFMVANMLYNSNFNKELARKLNGQVSIDKFCRIYHETSEETIDNVSLN